jgi:hypothetical protein
MSPTDTPALSDTWMTVTDAAGILGCSTRTVERRVARGELRRQERDGRVFVAIPDTLRRPADRMVQAVQEDAEQMRQLSVRVSEATEQAGIILREAVAEARSQAATALLRAEQAEGRVRQARRLSATLACAVVGAVSVTVSAWVTLTDEAERSRQEARQMSVTLSEARDQALSAQVRATVLEEQLDRALAERDGLGADIMELEYQLRQATDSRPTP